MKLYMFHAKINLWN